MDLNTITEVSRPRDRADLSGWRQGDAWLAGGSWLFSEPQPQLSRLVDLSGLGWRPLEASTDGLRIGATCRIADLDAFMPPPEWSAAPLIGQCCRAFLASFKIWNTATVGGNLCMALPAGPMISLAVALDGGCVIWDADAGERRIAVRDFVIGPQRNALAPGEVLRMIELPAAALSRRTAFRRISLNPHGRSAVLLIATQSPAEGDFRLTVTAATRRPFQFVFPAVPTSAALQERIAEGIPETEYHDDVHGAPQWRAHMTMRFAEQLRVELGG
jgi:CO/xanthine dehydrogenase FAD-binding subunit